MASDISVYREIGINWNWYFIYFRNELIHKFRVHRGEEQPEFLEVIDR